MPEASSYWVHSLSVVVTAEFQNPPRLTHEALVEQKIVPANAIDNEGMTTPVVSIVRYADNTHWMMDQTKLTVDEVVEATLRDTSLIHERVRKYLAANPNYPYQSLGLNAVISIRQRDPRRWLIQRFLKQGDWRSMVPEILGMQVAFEIAADPDVTCTLTIQDGSIPNGADGVDEAITIDVNMHHAGPLDAEHLREAIARWPERQAFVKSTLDVLLMQD